MRWFYLVPALIFLSLGIGRLTERHEHPLWSGIEVRIAHRQMQAIAGYLRDFRHSKGHYPTNDEGLLAVRPLIATFDEYGRSYSKLAGACLVKSGIVSPRDDPYIYENRRGSAPSQFTDSGASRDLGRNFSIRVDDGIYLWSIGIENAYADYLSRRRADLAYVSSALLAAAVLLLFYARQTWITSRRRPANALPLYALDAFLTGAGYLLMLANTPRLSCYAVSYTRPRVELQMAFDYNAVMKKYRDRGVISDAAYQKIVASLAEDAHIERKELK